MAPKSRAPPLCRYAESCSKFLSPQGCRFYHPESDFARRRDSPPPPPPPPPHRRMRSRSIERHRDRSPESSRKRRPSGMDQASPPRRHHSPPPLHSRSNARSRTPPPPPPSSHYQYRDNSSELSHRDRDLERDQYDEYGRKIGRGRERVQSGGGRSSISVSDATGSPPRDPRRDRDFDNRPRPATTSISTSSAQAPPPLTTDNTMVESPTTNPSPASPSKPGLFKRSVTNPFGQLTTATATTAAAGGSLHLLSSNPTSIPIPGSRASAPITRTFSAPSDSAARSIPTGPRPPSRLAKDPPASVTAQDVPRTLDLPPPAPRGKGKETAVQTTGKTTVVEWMTKLQIFIDAVATRCQQLQTNEELSRAKALGARYRSDVAGVGMLRLLNAEVEEKAAVSKACIAKLNASVSQLISSEEALAFDFGSGQVTWEKSTKTELAELSSVIDVFRKDLEAVVKQVDEMQLKMQDLKPPPLPAPAAEQDVDMVDASEGPGQKRRRTDTGDAAKINSTEFETLKSELDELQDDVENARAEMESRQQDAQDASGRAPSPPDPDEIPSLAVLQTKLEELEEGTTTINLHLENQDQRIEGMRLAKLRDQNTALSLRVTELETRRAERDRMMKSLRDAVAGITAVPPKPSPDVLREEIAQSVRDAIGPVLRKAMARNEQVLQEERSRLRDDMHNGLADVRILMDHVLPALKATQAAAGMSPTDGVEIASDVTADY